MEKEEILAKYTTKDFIPELGATKTVIEYSKAMQEYADQETERLKAELEAKDKESKENYDMAFDLGSMLEKTQSELSKLKSELTELKERHKRDVMEAFGDGWEKGIARPKLMCVNLEQYYKQKFEK